jgi:hypothetical protein
MLGNLLVGNIGTHGGPIEVENGSADVGVAPQVRSNARRIPRATRAAPVTRSIAVRIDPRRRNRPTE